MEEFYLLITAIIVGLVSLKLLPAKKLAAANRRLRARFSGVALIIMYLIICTLFFVGAYFICVYFNAGETVRSIILGVLLGIFIGFSPIIDKKNVGEEDGGEGKDESEEE